MYCTCVIAVHTVLYVLYLVISVEPFSLYVVHLHCFLHVRKIEEEENVRQWELGRERKEE